MPLQLLSSFLLQLCFLNVDLFIVPLHACSFLGPMLFGCLMALMVWSVFQIFLPPGPVQNTIFSLLGSILFSAYIVYDTDNLIQRKFSAWCGRDVVLSVVAS